MHHPFPSTKLKTRLGAFDREITHSLHQHVTLPNLPRRLFSNFIPPPAFPSLLTSNPIYRAQNKLLASALYNSSLHLKNRHLDTTIIHAINKRVRLAQAIVGDYTPCRKKELTKLICTIVSESEACLARCGHFPQDFSSEVRPHDSDTYCLAAILGATGFLKESAQKDTVKVLRGSQIFGSPLPCAIYCQQLETIKWLINNDTWLRVPVGAKDIIAAIELGNLEILRVLVSAWVSDKCSTKGHRDRPQTYDYWKHYEAFVIRAVKSGNAEVLRCLLESPDSEDLKTLEDNDRASAAAEMVADAAKRKSAIEIAKRTGFDHIAKVLLEKEMAHVRGCGDQELFAIYSKVKANRIYSNQR